MWLLKKLRTNKDVCEEPSKIEVTLYTTVTSKTSTNFEYGYWRWSTKPSSSAIRKGLTVLKTTVKVNISELPFQFEKGDYRVVVKSKALQRKLIAISKPWRYKKEVAS